VYPGSVPGALLVLSLAAPPASAELHSLSARLRVGGERVIGVEQPERFESVDLGLTWRLPWEHYGASGWGLRTRVLTSAGWMTGAEDSALVLSALPLLAFGSRDGRFTTDFGLGAALLSRHRFAQQDFGGYLRFALTVGVSVPLYRQVGLGYRFMHYSDAALYGTDTIGADFHMVALSYLF
ncbi:MAG: acyloxyacyl hydrolase, partial [Moraxellaceae bacterium]|nr:acyloxyacyl hydrolase [Moraxellaceae bacterium]